MQVTQPDPRIRPRKIANVLPIDKFYEHYKTIAYSRHKCGACNKITWLEVDANFGLMQVCSECGYCATEDEDSFMPAENIARNPLPKIKKSCTQPSLF
jgi:hypothetical protein